MTNEIWLELRKEILNRLKNMENIPKGTKDDSEAVDNVVGLMRIYLENEKLENETEINRLKVYHDADTATMNSNARDRDQELERLKFEAQQIQDDFNRKMQIADKGIKLVAIGAGVYLEKNGKLLTELGKTIIRIFIR